MKLAVIQISILLLALHLMAYPQQIQQVQYDGKDIVKNELIIKFKQHPGILSQSNGTPGRADVIKSKKAVVKKIWTTGAEHWSVSTDNLEALINELRNNPDVEYVEPNYIVRQSNVPNDPYLKNTWAVNGTSIADIGAMDAWNITKGDTSIVVGVIDSGIDYLHEDLKANIWTNKNEIPGNGIDDDKNGYVDDIHGWDFVNNDNDPMDDNNHGTHVAGIIGAKGGNNVGIAGVAWNVKLAAVKFTNFKGEGTISAAIAAIEYCITNGIKITNNSWGGTGESQALYDAISKANQAGMIFVAACGNSASDIDLVPQYPAAYNLPNIISVAANDVNDNLASFSNYGKNRVDLSAPGVNIYSCAPNNSYMTMEGTSMAAPFVTGAVVLIKSICPEKTNLEIINQLLSAVTVKSNYFGKTSTGGRLNLVKPLTNSYVGSIRLSAEEVNFGGVVINSSAMPQKKFSIYNNSAESITIDTIKSQSGFLVSNNTGNFSDLLLNFQLGAFQSADIQIKAAPAEERPYDSFISLRLSHAGTVWNKKVRCRLTAFTKGTVMDKEDVSGYWSKSMSPIIINSPVKVLAGQKLEIGPGVEVFFFNNSGISSSSTDLTSAFNIRALGTRQDSIYFKSADTTNPWSGFTLSGRGRYIFEYCNFLYASKISSGEIEGNGGAIFCSGPDLRVVNSRFYGNHASSEGGAIQYLGNEGIVYIDSSGFFNNDANLGGALVLRGKENWLMNSEFTGNKCSQGIVKIQGASAETYSNEKAFVYNCSFINNSSNYGGNMIDASAIFKIIIKNCLGAMNNVGLSQGVINLNSISTAILSNCTLYDNSTGGDGAGLSVGKVNECVLENSILWDKYDIEIKTYQADYQKFVPSFNSIKNYNGGTGNINVAPDFSGSSYYSLTSNSELRDKGNPLAIFNDQDGSRNDLGFEGGNQLTFYPAHIDFGKNSPVSSTKKTIPVECVSFNKEAIQIQSWSLSSDAFTVAAIPGQILPEKVNEILISFSPKQVKSYNDTLYISTNLIAANKIKISLSGVCEEINSIGGSISGELKNQGLGVYHVVNDLLVPQGSTLVIDPGVKLLFQPDTKLIVEGDLEVKGTDDQKVVFSSESDTSYAGMISVRQFNKKDILVENLVMRKMTGFKIQSINRKIIFNNCEFSDNKNLNEVNFPFINNQNSAAEFNHCKFISNKTDGPVIYSSLGKLYVNNCLFNGNSSAWAYLLSENNYTYIYNSSIFKNKSNSGIVVRTDPAYGAFKDSLKIVNTILWDNINANAKYPYEINLMSKTMVLPDNNPDVKIFLEMTNTCIPGGRKKMFIPSNTEIFWTSCLETDPGLADSIGNLAGNSSCINSGANSFRNLPFSVKDLAGNYRIWNNRIDIGAYEFGSRKYYPTPEIPTLFSPKNQTTIAKDVTFRWKAVPDAVSYLLQVSSTSTFETSSSDSTLTDTVKVMSLDSGSKYFWRVLAKNKENASQWSNVWSFSTIISAPLTPVLNKPGNNSKDNALTLKLSWKAIQFTDKYRLIISEDEKFTKIMLIDSSIIDTVKEVKELKEGMKYFWKVSSLNSGGESSFSDVWDFTTLLNAPDSLKASVLSKNKLVLSWNDRSKGEAGFIIERKQSSDIITLDTVKADLISFTDSTVQLLTSYQYRVRSYTTYAQSNYSNVASVTVTSVDKYSLIPKDYTLLQNYPNPFNPATVIKYGLPLESQVKLVIYNSLGQVVRELVNSTQSAGFHEVNLNAGSISSGVYYYSLEARAADGSKDYRKIRKMMVVK